MKSDNKRLLLESDPFDRSLIRKRVFCRVLYSSVTGSGRPSSISGRDPSLCAVLWSDHANLDVTKFASSPFIALADVALAG